MSVRQILAAAIAALVLSAAAARAELEFCNDTSAEHRVAISYQSSGVWVSQGWWMLPPGDCFTALEGELTGRFYYFRAESPGWAFRHDSIPFCTAPADFEITGSTGCGARGHDVANFARIDTARAGPSHRQLLGSHSAPRAGSGSAGISGPGAFGDPFTGQVVFQGCRPGAGATGTVCTFVGKGIKLHASSTGQSPPWIFSFLKGLPAGAPLAIDGDLSDRFGATARISLRRAVSRPPDDQDRILAQLQGRWSSVQHAADRFIVSGAERCNAYGGTETSADYLSVQQFCGDHGGSGPYLYAWASQGGTGMCYRIDALSSRELTLTYLPMGTTLQYRKDE